MRRIKKWNCNSSHILQTNILIMIRHVWHLKEVAVGFSDEIRPEAVRIQALCREYGATFIIDDHVELVKELHADGVHLGKKDMPIAEARQILGKDFIIGGTANTFEDVQMHYQAGADYIGCGPFRFTTTKKNLSPILGLEGYKAIVSQMKTAGSHWRNYLR